MTTSSGGGSLFTVGALFSGLSATKYALAYVLVCVLSTRTRPGRRLSRKLSTRLPQSFPAVLAGYNLLLVLFSLLTFALFASFSLSGHPDSSLFSTRIPLTHGNTRGFEDWAMWVSGGESDWSAELLRVSRESGVDGQQEDESKEKHDSSASSSGNPDPKGFNEADNRFVAPVSLFLCGIRLYRLSKYVELLDTVFFFVRGSLRQITPLHVFHHSSMLVLAEFSAQQAPWPSVSLPMMLNSLVHVVMYAYYLLSSSYAKSLGFDRESKGFARVRRGVTEVQLAQFFVLVFHALVGYVSHGFCVYSVLYGLSMIALFSHFYARAYLSKRRPSAASSTTEPLHEKGGKAQ